MKGKNKLFKLILLAFIFSFLYLVYTGSKDSIVEASTPVCKGLSITNLTKNLKCNSSNPDACKVSKGDRLKLVIQSENANAYNFVIAKRYSNLNDKVFFDTSLYGELPKLTTTVDDIKGLVSYEVRGYVRRLDGDNSNLNDNSSSNCRVVFNLPEAGSQAIEDRTPSCKSMDIKILTKNNYACRRNTGDCPVDKNDEIELTVESSEAGSNVIGYMITREYKDGRELKQEEYKVVNGSRYSYRYKVGNEADLKGIMVEGYVGAKKGANNIQPIGNYFSCVANFNLLKITPTSTPKPTSTPDISKVPVCKGLSITNLTKNLKCNSSNPDACKVSKGDRLKFVIQSENANAYNFVIAKKYSSLNDKVFFDTSMYGESSELTTTVDDNRGLVSYEVRGYVRRLDGDNSNLNDNSSSNCRVVFNLPEAGSQAIEDRTPSCNSMDIKILTKNNYVCRRNTGDCPVDKNDEIELTIESSEAGSNIIGYFITKEYKDGRELKQEEYKVVNGSRYSYRYKVSNEAELKGISVKGFVGAKKGGNEFQPIGNDFSCVASFNFSQNQNTNNTNTPADNPQNGNTTTNNDNNNTVSINLNNANDDLTNNELVFNLEIKNNSDTELNISDLDLLVNYNSDVLNLKKIVLRSGEEEIEINSLNTNNLADIRDLVNNNVNLSKIKSNEKYEVFYYFGVNKAQADDKYCVDFVSEKYNQNLNKCIEGVKFNLKNDSGNNNNNNLLLYASIGVVTLLVSASILFIYRDKVTNLIRKFFNK